MNNALLVSDVSARLVACGFHVFAPAKVPAGDRGIAPVTLVAHGRERGG